ncbi:MAG: helix-turn-helix domain-containing protein [Acidimicrobiia bacterium]|nr:helix-turn-helix domain-containing protein [Acidimicrobiia bacterium]
METTPRLAAQESAVLQALLDCRGRVVSRRELARLAGIADLNDRRCDSLLVSIRKVLGADAIRTVRGRGWMLVPVAVDMAENLLVA